MRHISDVLPLSHLIGGLRQSWLGSTQDPHTLGYPALVAVVFVALAIRQAGHTDRTHR
jgi:ABC-type polysaccharide/polyol phosphate export permease